MSSNSTVGPVGKESRFTKPREWCSHPERWHSTDSDSTEIEVSKLVGAFVRALQPDVVVETGTAWGQTAKMIGKVLRDNGQGHLYTLEVDQKRVEYCRNEVSGLPVTVVQSSSLNWEPPSNSQIGFAWFDSLLHLRIPEFEHYLQWMAKGTIVGFHDVAPHKKLSGWLDEYEDKNATMKSIRLHTPRGVTFAEVL